MGWASKDAPERFKGAIFAAESFETTECDVSSRKVIRGNSGQKIREILSVSPKENNGGRGEPKRLGRASYPSAL